MSDRRSCTDAWREMSQSEATGSGKFLHVGDDELFDIVAPFSLGIRTFHVLSLSNHLEIKGFTANNPAPESLVAALQDDPFEGR
jgi:predicted HAD superfamily hydrolase